MKETRTLRERDNYCCTRLINVLDRKNKERRRVSKATSERNDGENVHKFLNKIPFLAFPYTKKKKLSLPFCIYLVQPRSEPQGSFK
jgi:hypothetical protein